MCVCVCVCRPAEVECIGNRTVFLLESPSSSEPFYDPAGISQSATLVDFSSPPTPPPPPTTTTPLPPPLPSFLPQVTIFCPLRYAVLMVEDQWSTPTSRDHRNM